MTIEQKTTDAGLGFIQKETREFDFKDVKKQDFAALDWSLSRVFAFGRGNCKLQVFVNNTLCSFTTEKELQHFLNGFRIAMELNDPEYQNKLHAYESAPKPKEIFENRR